jgi:hypothetical protein
MTVALCFVFTITQKLTVVPEGISWVIFIFTRVMPTMPGAAPAKSGACDAGGGKLSQSELDPSVLTAAEEIGVIGSAIRRVESEITFRKFENCPSLNRRG